MPNTKPKEAARRLIRLHGAKARQQIVDEIVTAIRAHDLEAAKRWEHVGREVDAHFNAEA